MVGFGTGTLSRRRTFDGAPLQVTRHAFWVSGIDMVVRSKQGFALRAVPWEA